jgi:hypothetical protein
MIIGVFRINLGFKQIDLNEELAKLNRNVALRALCPNARFSKVVFS